MKKAKRGGLIVGHIQMNRKGFGFVEMPDNSEADAIDEADAEAIG